MRNKLLVTLTTMASFGFFAQSPDLIWANSTGNSEWQRMTDMVIDANSNSYCVGDYKGVVDFDPSSSTMTLSSNGNDDMFLQKFNGSGILSMVISMGGIGIDRINSVHVDDDGYIYLTGIFSDTVDFDPGSGIQNRISLSEWGNTFILKLNSQGQFQWVNTLVSTIHNRGTDIKTDYFGNIIIAGHFAGTIDFEPGNGVTELTSQGSAIFILKLNSIGELIWVKQVSATSDEKCNAIDIDNNGNIYATGEFANHIDLDPGPSYQGHYSYGQNDLFAFSLTSNGDYRWSHTAGGNQPDSGYDIAVSKEGDCFVIGEFISELIGENVTSNGWRDIVLYRFSTNGNVDWVKSIGGISSDIGSAISVDPDLNIYIAGNFLDSVDFDLSSDEAVLVSNFQQFNIFAAKLDSSANHIWSAHLDGNGSASVASIICDSIGRTFISGYYNGSIDFDPNGSSATNTSAGDTDLFTLRLDTILHTNTVFTTSKFNVNIYPNPTQSFLKIETDYPVNYTITTFEGKTLFTGQIGNETNTIDMRKLSAGLYRIYLMTNEGIYSSEVTKL